MPVVRNEAPWGFPLEIESDKRIEVLVDTFDFSPVPENTVRIIVMQEPISLAIKGVQNNPECYTFVFTYYQEVLDSNPKAKLFIGTNPMVNPDRHYEKKFGVSTVVGWKYNPDYSGYGVRHQLWNRQDEILIPKDFYRSEGWKFPGYKKCKNPMLGAECSRKEGMFDCMFHIAIENVIRRNMFTEKIIDCFFTRTIPIHYGTPNIGDFFNLDGIIKVDSVDSIILVCNGLTSEFYQSRLNVIEENYNKALAYRNYSTCLQNAIIKLL